MSTTANLPKRRFTGTLKLLIPAQAVPSPEEIRMRNLKLAREHFPDLFDDKLFPPMPENIHVLLRALEISTAEVQILLEGWTRPERTG
jgi:hypothetical protein